MLPELGKSQCVWDLLFAQDIRTLSSTGAQSHPQRSADPNANWRLLSGLLTIIRAGRTRLQRDITIAVYNPSLWPPTCALSRNAALDSSNSACAD